MIAIKRADKKSCGQCEEHRQTVTPDYTVGGHCGEQWITTEDNSRIIRVSAARS